MTRDDPAPDPYIGGVSPGVPSPVLREVNGRLLVAALREQALKEEAEGHAAEMNALLDSLHDGVVVLNPAGWIVMANAPARQILGLSRTTRGHPASELLQLRLQGLDRRPIPPHDSPFQAALRGERFSGREYLLLRPDAPTARISFSGSAVCDDAGAVRCALAVCRDVTELRALERLKQDYGSLISHDLRNPLASIMFLTEILRLRSEKQGASDSVGDLQSIQHEAERMEAMINDLLESTRIDSGALVLRRVPTDLVGLATALCGRLGRDSGRVHVRADAEGAIPHVPADSARVERVIMNLVTNALRYSAPGSPVTIRIEAAPGEVRVSVTDRGRGITSADLSHVFDRFFRVTRNDHPQGVGLGLYISRMVVQEHGGRIWGESVVGHGSTFTFSLPTN